MAFRNVLLGLAILVGVGATASADTITYVTPNNSKDSDNDPVNARATFMTSANTITILLENLQANPKAAGQTLSDLFFSVSTGQGAGSVTSATGIERTINATTKAFTDGSSAVNAGWGFSVSSGVFHLDDLNNGSSPKHTIIGPPDGSSLYSAANSSLLGNHNPFLTSITFTLNVSGVTSSSSISSAIFSFGTDSGDNITGIRATPEPATWVSLLAIGVVGLAYLQLRRRFQFVRT